MIRQLVGATPDPADIHPQLAEHQAQMIKRCPFLGPSVTRGLTIWSAYSANPEDKHQLLNLIAQYAELVRIARKSDGPLVCRNIAILGPRNTGQAQSLVDWPVWLGRNAYAGVQIVADRFWLGLGRRSGRGRCAMPAPAVSFIMIRCAIPRRDRLIVSDRSAEEMTALRAGPGDDGRDVFASLIGRQVSRPADAWAELVARFPIPISKCS